MAQFIEEDVLEDEEIEQEVEDRGDSLEEDEDEDEVEDVESTKKDDEEEGDNNEEDEEVETKKEPRIPKSRFDEVIQQREDAKERNLWLESQLEKLIGQANKQQEAIVPKVEVSLYDFDKAEEDYISLIIEGEISKASKLRNEINREQEAKMMNIIKNIESSVSTKAKSDSSALLEDERFNAFVETVEVKHPFLDSNHKDYNEEAVDTVNTLLAGYISAGKGKTEALRLAVAKVTPLYFKPEVKQSLGNKRTVEAGKKAAKAAAAQPVRTKNSATTKLVDNSDVDITKISEKEFAKLTSKERSLLRGD